MARLQAELSKKARQRLKCFDYYHTHPHNVRLTCHHFDISPQTFYRWKKRYNPHHLASLEGHSCRPKRARQPTYSVELVSAVQKLREEYPRWGKDKLVVLLRQQGFSGSASTVGRIITRLKARGMLKEPIRHRISAHRKGISRPYGIRKPKDYQITQPGDLIIGLRQLQPAISYDLAELREELLKWEQVYNTVRPHQALGYATPLKFLERWQKSLRKEDVSLRY